MHTIDQPVAGFYRARLVKGGPWVPVRIWFGPPPDPDDPDGPPLDRSHRWQAIVGDDLVTGHDVQDVWIRASGEPVDRQRYDYMRAVRDWAMRADPSAPEANPTKPVNLRTMRPLF